MTEITTLSKDISTFSNQTLAQNNEAPVGALSDFLKIDSSKAAFATGRMEDYATYIGHQTEKKLLSGEYKKDPTLGEIAWDGTKMGAISVPNTVPNLADLTGRILIYVGLDDFGNEMIRTADQWRINYQSDIPPKAQKTFTHNLSAGAVQFGTGLSIGTLAKQGLKKKAGKLTENEINKKAASQATIYGTAQEASGAVEDNRLHEQQANLNKLSPDDAYVGILNIAVKTVGGYLGEKLGFKGVFGDSANTSTRVIKRTAEGAVSEGSGELTTEVIQTWADEKAGRIPPDALDKYTRWTMAFWVGATLGGGASGYDAIVYKQKAFKALDETIGHLIPPDEKKKVYEDIFKATNSSIGETIIEQALLSDTVKGEYQNLQRVIFLAIQQQSKETGAFQNIPEEKRAQMFGLVAKQQANITVAEAISRRIPIKEVLDNTRVVVEDGQIYLKGKFFNTPSSRIQISTEGADNDRVVMVDQQPQQGGEQPVTLNQEVLAEQAVKDGKNLPDIEARNINYNIDTKANRDVVVDVFNAIIPENERASYIDKEGYITPEGIMRVERAMLGSIIDDAVLFKQIVESQDESIKALTKALTDISSVINGLENRTRKGKLSDGYTIKDDIKKAVRKLVKAKIEGKTLSDIDMVDLTPSQKELLASFKNAKSIKQIKNTIARYANVVDNVAKKRLFRGKKVPVSKDSILRTNRLYQEQIALADEMKELDRTNEEYTGETINIDGVEKTVYNSEGNRIAKSEKALRAFYNWFGDSKVVDEQGRPLVVYHYSGSPRNVLSRDYARKSIEIEGVFFMPKKDPYKEYGEYEHPVYLKIENPADYETAYNKHGIQLGVEEDSGVKVREWLQENGYDGVMLYEDGKLYELIAFESTQIKSVDNRGTFDINNPNIYYQMVGEKSNLTKQQRSSLEKAKMFEKTGMDKEKIFQETGWFKGADGKWRIEISDKEAKINKDLFKQLLKQPIFVKLDKFLSHDKLFDLYPELRNVVVFVDHRDSLLGKEATAGFSYATKDVEGVNAPTIIISKKAKIGSIKKTIMHEIQHYIQREEGFASGGNIRSFDKAITKAQEQASRYDTNLKINLIKEKFGVDVPEHLMIKIHEDVFKGDTENKSYIYEELNLDRKAVKDFLLSKKDWLIGKLTEEAERLSASIPANSPLEYYLKIYGEVEARNTEARMNMSAKERRNSYPETTQDVKDADAIVIFDNDVQLSYNPDALKTKRVVKNYTDRNILEFNLETLNDKESMKYMEETAIKQYGVSKKDFDMLVGKVKEIAEISIELAKENGNKRFTEWNKKSQDRYINALGNLVPRVSSFKTNGDYPLNMDLSTLCTKRYAMNVVLTHLIKNGHLQQLGVTQIDAIKDILRAEGIATPCDVCFGEAKRFRQLAYANTFAYEWESVRIALGITDTNDVGTPREFTAEQQQILEEMTTGTKKERNKAFNKYIPKERRRERLKRVDIDAGITPDKMFTIAKLFKSDPTLAGVFNPEWLMTTSGIDWLFRTYSHTDIRGAIAGMYASATPKPLEGFNIYDPLSWHSIYDSKNKGDKLEKVYAIGGFRGQSFSDFSAIQTLDYLQFFLDLSLRGLPAHMYTKVPAIIELFGETGCMFNMSLVPEVLPDSNVPAGLTADGEYAWSKDSFPVEDAKRLRAIPEYKGRVGIVTVGVSDQHIFKMLDDPEIDMIIPYHASGIPVAIKNKTGLNMATNYEKFQKTGGLKKKDPDYPFNEKLREIGDPRKTADDYLKWCAKNGYTPKFKQFSHHENYYKLLEDFRSYDNDGNPVIQSAVNINNLDTNSFVETLGRVLQQRESEVDKQENIVVSENALRKIEKLLSKQRIDGQYRDVFIDKIKSAIGKKNIVSLRQIEFFAQMEKDLNGSENSKDAIQVYRNNAGFVYGYVKNKKIVLNENLFNANTPAHEFTHLWSDVARNVNPKLWEKGKALLKQSEVWNEVMSDDLYLSIRNDEDLIASETLARIVGRENEELIRKAIDPQYKALKSKDAITTRILNWFKELWGQVRSVFDFKVNGRPLTYEEFIHMPLKDLWDETRHKEFIKTLSGIESQENMSFDKAGYNNNRLYQKAFSASRVDYERPSLKYIGTGEGNQVHGWGLYYALHREIAEEYRRKFSKKQTQFISFGDPKFNKETGKYENAFNGGSLEFEVYQDFKLSGEDIDVLLEAYEQTRFIDDRADERIAIVNKYKEYFVNNDVHYFVDDSQSTAQVHEVDIPENPYLLDEDATFFQQPDIVQDAFNKILNELTDEQISKEFSGTKYPENRDVLSRMWKLEDYDFINTGRGIYKSLSKMLGSDKAASLMLAKHGVKGITYEGREDGRCFVIFNDADVEVINKFYQEEVNAESILDIDYNDTDNNETWQSLEDRQRKTVLKGFYDQATKSIGVTKDADFSTLPHEFAHFWFDNMFDYVNNGEASAEYIERFEAVKKFVGLKDGERPTAEHHEKFARAYEKMLLTGTTPNVKIMKVFEEYKEFIEDVYNNITEVDEKAGAEYEPLTEDMYNFFNSMVGHSLPRPKHLEESETLNAKENEKLEVAAATIEKDRNDVLEKQAEEYSDFTPVETVGSSYLTTPVQSEGKTSPLTAHNKLTGSELEAGAINMEYEIERATEFVKANPKLAEQIVNGLAEHPKGYVKNTIYIAYNNMQEKLGNTKNVAASVLNQALELHALGQEIATQRLVYGVDPVNIVNDVIRKRTDKIAKQNKKKTGKEITDIVDRETRRMVSEGKSAEDIVKKLSKDLAVKPVEAKPLPKNENAQTFNNVLKYVKERLGMGMSLEEATNIVRITQDMNNNLKNARSKTGNPTLDYFEKMKELDKYAQSLAPSSNLKIILDIIMPGNLLTGIKSTGTNIVSTFPTALFKTATRRLHLGLQKSVVDPQIEAMARKEAMDIYLKTGYHIFSMDSVLKGDFNVLGEELTRTSGKGFIRAWGRLYEKLIYHYSLGVPDVYFKNRAFVDYASLMATKMANGNKQKATEMFRDACLVEPKTQEGIEIRKQAREEALVVTYQNESVTSETALKLRSALDRWLGIGKFVEPFVKTPANLVESSLRVSVGGVYALTNETVRAIRRGGFASMTPENKRLISENMLGVLIALALASSIDEEDYMPAYALASSKDRQLAKELNIPYNSVRFGNTWYSLDYIGVLAAPLVSVLQAKKEESLYNQMFGFVKGSALQAATLPGLGAVSDLVKTFDEVLRKSGDDFTKDATIGMIDDIYARAVPMLLTDIAKALDPYEREKEGLGIQQNIPILREELPKKVSVTSGRAEKLGNPFFDIFAGARIKEGIRNSVADELKRLNDAGYGVSLTRVTDRGKLSEVDEQTKKYVLRDYAEMYAERVGELIETEEYQELEDAEKSSAIGKIRTRILKELREEYLEKGE